jgi:hypothetical protein
MWWDGQHVRGVKNQKKYEANVAAGNIPIETFREACARLKVKKGWTWQRMAKEGGWSWGQLSGYLWAEKYRTIGEDVAKGFLRRCVGMPEEMSTHQVRVEREREKKMKRWEKENG